MKLDLIKDFNATIEQFFNQFVDRLNGRVDDALEQSILSQGDFILDKLLYFCCAKKYFGLSKQNYCTSKYKGVLIIRQNNKHWTLSDSVSHKEVLDAESSLLIEKLQRHYPGNKQNDKLVVSFLVQKKNSVVIISGININVSKNNQVFFIWRTKIKLSSNQIMSTVVWKQQRLLYKRYYLNYVELKKVDASLTLQQYSGTIDIPLKTFQRNFKKYIGTSFYDYHIQERLLESVNLLMFTSLSVTEIAFECGYENYRTFLTAFGKDQIYIPLDYRTLL